GAQVKFQGVAAHQGERAGNAAVSGSCRLRERGIVGGRARGRRGGADDLAGRKRAQGQFAATGQDGRQPASRRVADQQKQRLLRRLFEDLEQRVGGIRIKFV